MEYLQIALVLLLIVGIPILIVGVLAVVYGFGFYEGRFEGVNRPKLKAALDALISEKPYQQVLFRAHQKIEAAEEDLSYLDYLIAIALRSLSVQQAQDVVDQITRYRHKLFMSAITLESLGRLVSTKSHWWYKEGDRVRFNRDYSYDWAHTDPRFHIHVKAGTVGRIFNVERIAQGDEAHYFVRIGSDESLIAVQNALDPWPTLLEKFYRFLRRR